MNAGWVAAGIERNEGYMQAFIISTMNQFGYFGIAFLIALENVFPPIPSEVILTFGGFMTTTTRLTAVGVIVSATIGSVIGSAFLYGIGRILSPARLRSLLGSKLFQAMGMKAGDVHHAGAWFHRYGKAAVLIGRCVPIVRSVISIPAGMARLPLPLFFLLTTLGSAIWNTGLVLLGVMAGSSWEKIVGYLGEYTAITVIVLAVACAVSVVMLLRRRRKKM